MSYIGNEPVIGHFPVDEFTSNGSSQTYTLSKTPPTVNSIEVSVGGLLQPPSVYSISGTTLTLPTSGANVPNGIKVVVRHLGEKLQVAIGTIADDAITTSKIADNAVTNAKINDVNGYKLSGTVVAKGDGASTPGKVKINCEMNSHGVTIQSPAHSSSADYTLTLPTTDGNASEFLQTDGSGVLSWGTAGGGAWNIIGSSAASNSASLTITGINSTYQTYAIVGENLIPSSGSHFGIRVGDGGGIDSGGSDYANQLVIQEIGGTSYNATGSSGDDKILITAGNAPSIVSFQATLHQSLNGTDRPCMKGHCMYTSTGQKSLIFSGWRLADMDVNQMQFLFDSGNITSGRITIWGLAWQ